jgi:hypothetical protein
MLVRAPSRSTVADPRSHRCADDAQPRRRARAGSGDLRVRRMPSRNAGGRRTQAAREALRREAPTRRTEKPTGPTKRPRVREPAAVKEPRARVRGWASAQEREPVPLSAARATERARGPAQARGSEQEPAAQQERVTRVAEGATEDRRSSRCRPRGFRGAGRARRARPPRRVRPRQSQRLRPPSLPSSPAAFRGA